MAQLKWKPARKRIINYGTKKGGIVGVEFDMTESFFVGLDGTSSSAVQEMVRRMNDAMFHVFLTNGMGMWEPNGSLTEEIKGHDRVMLGRTHAMLESIGSTAELLLTAGRVGARFASNTASGYMIRPGTFRKTPLGYEAQYGWPTTPHPDAAGSIDMVTGEVKEPQPGRGITIEDIAMLHEVGFTIRLPTAKGQMKTIRPRPWLTLAADIEAPNVIAVAMKDVAQSIDAFGATAVASTAGNIRVHKTGSAPSPPPIPSALAAKSIAAESSAAGAGRKKQLFNRRKKK